MQSKAATVDQYLAELPPDRRAALQAVRKTILKNLDRDYEEGMGYGMIGYYVPHRVFPPGYHCDPRQPLPFAGLASQKNYMSLYLMTIYGPGGEQDWFRTAWARTGKKLDMGKCCIRFRKLEDLALDVVAEAIRRVPAKAYVAHYVKLRESASTASKPVKSRAPRKPTKKKPATAARKSPKRPRSSRIV